MFLGVGAGVPKGVHTSIRRAIPDITPTIGSLLSFPTPYATGKSMIEILTSVGAESRIESLPASVHLAQNYPNPFNPTTTISYQLPKASSVSLKIFNPLGQEIAMVVNEQKSPGYYQAMWNASSVPTGIYFYRLSVVPSARRDLVPTEGRNGQAGEFVETKKMLLVK